MASGALRVKTFHHTHVLSREPCDGPLRVQIGGLDDERVALPVSS